MISQYLARIGRIAVPMMIFSVLIGLGLWQLDRAEQKRARADTYADRMSAAPIALEAWLDAGLEDVRWRRVSVHGRFGEQVLVLDNRVLDGRLGVEVLSPFELESGRTVLVNRGWVPTSAQRSVAPVVDTPRTPLTITGHAGPVPVTGLKLNAQADSFDILAPAMARVQNIDLDAISSRYDLTLLPYVVYLNEDSPAGFVRRWKTPGDGSEKHRAYAVQWFAMAGILMVIYFILRRGEGTERE